MYRALCPAGAIASAPVFFLWNPWWGDLIIVLYALVANLPCILVQRYNRFRLQKLRVRERELKNLAETPSRDES
jgi:hypothetical protein